MASSSALLLCSLLVLASAAGSHARDLLVGGGPDGAWKVPQPAQPDALAQWAQKSRFHVGDNLVFKFDAATDSVLEVTEADYKTCSTASPVAAYKASGAAVPLPKSGPRYFVSGAPGSCAKGEKVVVVVMSEKHGRRVPAAAPPAKAPSSAAGLVDVPAPAPAPAPATGAAWRMTAGSGSGYVLLGSLLGALLAGF